MTFCSPLIHLWRRTQASDDCIIYRQIMACRLSDTNPIHYLMLNYCRFGSLKHTSANFKSNTKICNCEIAFETWFCSFRSLPALLCVRMLNGILKSYVTSYKSKFDYSSMSRVFFIKTPRWISASIDLAPPEIGWKDGQPFTNDNFKYILLNENIWISIKIVLMFTSKGFIDNKKAFAQIMAWHWTSDKPWYKPMIAHFTVASMNHLASMSWWDYIDGPWRYCWQNATIKWLWAKYASLKVSEIIELLGVLMNQCTP